MIGLDTNLLVRVLIGDDANQLALATPFLKTLAADGPGYLSHAVLIELCWVLESRYSYSRAQLLAVMEGLLATAELQIEKAEAVAQAVQSFQYSKAGFADCLIASGAVAAGCEYTVTFDDDASMLPGMRLLR